MISNSLKRIAQSIDNFETAHNVTVLYAAEAGSRAWGFASSDSDYDVRFIYVNRLQDYVKINQIADNFEMNIEIDTIQLDMVGWSLQKTLRLMAKSNAALLEWLDSPTIYVNKDMVQGCLQLLATDFIDPKALVHHYANMAARCFKEHLNMPLVKLKKYFYAIRPILAAYYVIEYKAVPPVDFDTLFSKTKDIKGVLYHDPYVAIENLLQAKRVSKSESDKQSVDIMLLQWIDDSINRLRTVETKVMPKTKLVKSYDHLDKFLYEQVTKYDRVNRMV